MAGPGGERRRGGWSLESFTVDEIINLVQFKLHTRSGRRFLVASCFVLAVVIALVPIVRRSGGARPADALSNRPTAPITLPSTSTVPLTADTLLVPVATGGLNRIGPPLTTAPPATTAPRITAPSTTAAPVTTPPSTAPPATAAPVTTPPPTAPPVTAPPTTIPDGPVVVPVG